jgi:hypothetical protein
LGPNIKSDFFSIEDENLRILGEKRRILQFKKRMGHMYACMATLFNVRLEVGFSDPESEQQYVSLYKIAFLQRAKLMLRDHNNRLGMQTVAEVLVKISLFYTNNKYLEMYTEEKISEYMSISNFISRLINSKEDQGYLQ